MLNDKSKVAVAVFAACLLFVNSCAEDTRTALEDQDFVGCYQIDNRFQFTVTEGGLVLDSEGSAIAKISASQDPYGRSFVSEPGFYFARATTGDHDIVAMSDERRFGGAMSSNGQVTALLIATSEDRTDPQAPIPATKISDRSCD